MKNYLYILESENKRYYVGSTNNLERRLKQHQRGHTSTTLRMKNWILVFQQEYESLEKAREAEKVIKSWKRKDYITKIVNDGVFHKVR
jgi:putative endonuclease